jgi:hypothetical protein
MLNVVMLSVAAPNIELAEKKDKQSLQALIKSTRTNTIVWREAWPFNTFASPSTMRLVFLYNFCKHFNPCLIFQSNIWKPAPMTGAAFLKRLD